MSLFDIFKNKKNNAIPETKAEAYGLTKEQEEQYALEAYRKIQSETKIPCVKIKLTDKKTTIFQSKIGGMGYIPRDGEFPTDSKGRQLRLLAQIDCSDIKLNEFPRQGLLQFWILNNDSYGQNFEDNANHNDFKIIYHRDMDLSVTESEIKAKFIENEFDNKNTMPNSGEFGMEFELSENSLSVSDCRFDRKFTETFNELYPEYKIDSYGEIDVYFDDYDDAEDSWGHKIGGYPEFTQWDPRDENTTYDFLLLQLDSDYESADNVKIMWGDAGICNFFINSEKLKNLDFSDVIYNWDCY